MQRKTQSCYVIPEMCTYIESGLSYFSSSPGPVKEVEVHVVASVPNISIGKYSNATETSCVNYKHTHLLMRVVVNYFLL